MFSTTIDDKKDVTNTNTDDMVPVPAKKSPFYPTQNNHMNMTSLDTLLDYERQSNKNEPWNKLDKTRKIYILHHFSKKFGVENNLSPDNADLLAMFFNTCLEKGKLTKANDVLYDRETHEIESIPSLLYIPEKNKFMLKSVETKRVSTMKSMSPKRTISSNTKS